VIGDINISTGNSLRFAGTSVCTSADCSEVSDRRLKEKITPMHDSLSKILSLKPVEYYFIDKDKYTKERQIGYIAQDVQKVFPEVIKKDKKSGLLPMAHSHLVAPLTQALQELSGHQNELSKRVASLEDKNDQLKNENVIIKKENIHIKEKCERLEADIAELKKIITKTIYTWENKSHVRLSK
jgi:hypothetical protein